MKLIFLGPPGAGKGTQAQAVCAALGVAHISTGDALRAAIKAGTKVGLEAKAFMDRGDLVPDAVIMGIVGELLAGPEMSSGFVFDGFPRTLAQAEALDGITPIDRVINIELSDEAIIERMAGRRVCSKCGHTTHVGLLNGKDVCPACASALIVRDDDAPEVVKSRLAVYHKQTMPLIDYYARKGLIQSVDGSIGRDALTARILDALRGI